MSGFPKKVVYYDMDYCGSWISKRESNLIRDYFIEKDDFLILNAKQLRQWMEEIINHEVKNAVVVFSIDIVPDTLVKDYEHDEPNIILNYLLNDGIIIWMGDIPFYYTGESGKEINELTSFQLIGLWKILDITLGSDTNLREVEITSEGKRLGLKEKLPLGSRAVRLSHGLIPLTVSKNRNNQDEANSWIKRGFIRLFDISRVFDTRFNIRNYLEMIYNIATYPIENIFQKWLQFKMKYSLFMDMTKNL